MKTLARATDPSGWEHNLLPIDIQEKLKQACDITEINYVKKQALCRYPTLFKSKKKTKDPNLARNNKGYRFGETHHRAKLTDFAVQDIRELHKNGFSLAKIAQKYNCGRTTIWKIVNGVIRKE